MLHKGNYHKLRWWPCGGRGGAGGIKGPKKPLRTTMVPDVRRSCQQWDAYVDASTSLGTEAWDIPGDLDLKCINWGSACVAGGNA